MKRYQFFHAPVLAFFSRSFYHDVSHNWKGTGFAYLLLLLTICWVPAFVSYQQDVSGYVKNEAPALIAQIPKIKIIKGQASADVAQPYIISDPETGNPLVILDTTGNTASLDGTEAFALITKTEVMYRKSKVESRVYSLAQIEEFTVDKQKVGGWVELFRSYSAVIFFPFVVIGAFVFRIVQALIYAAIGLLFARWVNTTASYESLIRLSVMAVTPAIIVNTVVAAAHIQIPFVGLVYFLSAMAYLFLGVKAASVKEGDDSQKVQPAPL